jgi:hypothetical protein
MLPSANEWNSVQKNTQDIFVFSVFGGPLCATGSAGALSVPLLVHLLCAGYNK